MKGACQAKTSPTLAAKSYFFDRQPQLTRQPSDDIRSVRPTDPCTSGANSDLFFIKHSGLSLSRADQCSISDFGLLKPAPTAFFGHPRRHSVATGTSAACLRIQPTQPADTQPRTF